VPGQLKRYPADILGETDGKTAIGWNAPQARAIPQPRVEKDLPLNSFVGMVSIVSPS
jgi:hypothetical protein